ncbi:hypothetical protein JN00_0277 [Metamycoplasma subdolum]|uniref:Uncharacterized protein n=1 Tax=Metamycoplasma subdolum TaxID=92407 RepID=A0A3M0A835_9BACT|nr:hypothetical protein [Metamycoplasma subdolum]RMA78635.1 hypothetical protein JN00_0277 [Metamycoplasma subdolum]WPB50763.1 hypothetical protein R9C05_01285 [Metamycoplasma subdolum]
MITLSQTQRSDYWTINPHNFWVKAQKVALIRKAKKRPDRYYYSDLTELNQNPILINFERKEGITFAQAIVHKKFVTRKKNSNEEPWNLAFTIDGKKFDSCYKDEDYYIFKFSLYDKYIFEIESVFFDNTFTIESGHEREGFLKLKVDFKLNKTFDEMTLYSRNKIAIKYVDKFTLRLDEDLLNETSAKNNFNFKMLTLDFKMLPYKQNEPYFNILEAEVYDEESIDLTQKYKLLKQKLLTKRIYLVDKKTGRKFALTPNIDQDLKNKKLRVKFHFNKSYYFDKQARDFVESQSVASYEKGLRFPANFSGKYDFEIEIQSLNDGIDKTIKMPINIPIALLDKNSGLIKLKLQNISKKLDEKQGKWKEIKLNATSSN